MGSPETTTTTASFLYQAIALLHGRFQADQPVPDHRSVFGELILDDGVVLTARMKGRYWLDCHKKELDLSQPQWWRLYPRMNGDGQLAEAQIIKCVPPEKAAFQLRGNENAPQPLPSPEGGQDLSDVRDVREYAHICGEVVEFEDEATILMRVRRNAPTPYGKEQAFLWQPMYYQIAGRLPLHEPESALGQVWSLLCDRLGKQLVLARATLVEGDRERVKSHPGEARSQPPAPRANPLPKPIEPLREKKVFRLVSKSVPKT